MEVAYELRGVLDLLLGIQPDDREDGGPLPHWPYARCLRRWQEIVAAPPAAEAPRWRSAVDPAGTDARERNGRPSRRALHEHAGEGAPVTVSAIDLEALVPVAQALDTFSVVYLQWLSNDVIWRAREMVVKDHTKALEQSWSYDLDEVATAIVGGAEGGCGRGGRPVGRRRDSGHAVSVAVADAPGDGRDGAEARRNGSARGGLSSNRRTRLPRAAPASNGCSPLSPTKRLLRTYRSMPAWTRPFARCSAIRPIPSASAIRRRGRRSSSSRAIGSPALPRASSPTRSTASKPRNSSGGSQNGSPTSCAAMRRSRAIVAVWPPAPRCGLALYRPVDLDKLAESNYLELRFSRDLHWTALLTAVDLIKHHARMLWRLVESQLTAAPLEARYQLMRRLAGDRALTGRHADQLRALSAPDALFLTIDPADDDDRRAAGAADPAHAAGATADPTIRSSPTASGCRRWIDRRPSWNGTTRSRARASARCSRKSGTSAATWTRSRCGRCSGWRDAAACWATTCSSASAIISASSSRRGTARCTSSCRCRGR